MANSQLSWQEILRRRQEAGFAGREAQLALFRENLLIPVDDERRRFVFSIHGDGGIGKTFLLGRLRQMAREMGRLCAIVDYGVYDVPEAMRSAAGQLERDGARLKRFAQRYAAYSKRQRDGGDHKSTQDGAAAAITRATVRAGLGAARGTAIGGAITGAIDPAVTADAIEQVREAAVDKMRQHDTAAAGESPVGELTEAFLAGLREFGKPVALFFDTYERTSAFLDNWLRDVLASRYGDPPVDIILVVAGRHALDTSAWSQYLGIMADLPLLPFTEVEARQMLANKGVTDERVVNAILRVSGGLPLAVAMLTEPIPADPTAVGDVTSNVVERFLQWEENPVRREAVLAAALPRRVNQDVLEVVVAAAVAADRDPGLFPWLEAQPFISRHSGGCQFHNVVRAPMIRLYRSRSPRHWRELHARLADTFGQWRDSQGDPSDEEHWYDAAWQDLEIERIYHGLCADPSGALGDALSGGIRACNQDMTAARKWTDMVCSVGTDCDVAEIAVFGTRLQAVLIGSDDGVLVAFVDELMRHPGFPATERSEAFRERGRQCRLARRYEEALAAFGRAIELNPENEGAFAGRGMTHHLMKRYEEAVSDLTRAIELAPEDASNLATRGQVFRYMTRYTEALADLTRAVEIVPGWDWALAERGEIYRLLERYEDAITDFTQAIELDPDYSWAFYRRGDLYRSMDWYAEALADYTRAIDIDPGYDWGIAARGRLYRKLGQLDAARADFIQAAAASPWDPGHAAELAMMGLPRRDDTTRYQALIDVEVTLETAGRESRALLEWLHAEGILIAERGPCLPGDRDGYAPGPSWRATAASSGTLDHTAFPAGVGVTVSRGAAFEEPVDHMTCPSCATRVALRHGGRSALAWDLLIDVIGRWTDGGPDTLACPHCGVDSGLAQWRIHPPWAFGAMMLAFWNWPPLSEEFIRRVSGRLGHRVVTITGSI